MVNGKKVLGVIGGMGPIATSFFMELVIKMTDASSDQEHLDMIIYNIPSIPDRTSYILDHNRQNPLPVILDIARKLEEQGAEFLAMPCCTAHYFQKELETSIRKPGGSRTELRSIFIFRISRTELPRADGSA